MKTIKNLSSIAAASMALGLLAGGCVQSRAPRNGVFNENQYVRKDFLVRSATDGSQDPGWMLKSSVQAVSTPNPLGSDMFFVAPGVTYGARLVRFDVTENKLQLLDQRELSADGGAQRTPEVVDSWPVSNVDIKYRVNLDGETTNFLEENQELDWQDRQWVKLQFSKNDMSDLAMLDAYTDGIVQKCVDASNIAATLVPDSFYTETDYMQWVVRVTLPLVWTDQDCVTAYGALGVEAERLGKTNVVADIKVSMSRATTPTYMPMVVEEKDPIRHKYGWAWENLTTARDPATQLLAARQMVVRFDPKKPITWYFDKSFPAKWKSIFTGANGVAKQTNDLLATAGVAARVDFQEADAGIDTSKGQRVRAPGDLRYNFLTWYNDVDTSSAFLGVTTPTVDPRTGELISADIAFNDHNGFIEDEVRRVEQYLQSIGAAPVDAMGNPIPVDSATDWTDGPPGCQDGDVLPIVSATEMAKHNAQSTVYAKMQTYLQKPQDTYGNLGPQDFVTHQDADFFNAYFQLLPYQIFADPNANQFVTPEGGGGVFGPADMWDRVAKERDFQTLAARIDRGETPYDGTGADGLKNATTFLNQFRSLTTAHNSYVMAKKLANKRVKADSPTAFTFDQVALNAARRCVNGKWQTKQEWIDSLVSSFWSIVFFHEFGHAMGLDHNFMASIDAPNFPHFKDARGNDRIGLYASSVMEYNARIADLGWSGGWAPYDRAAIAWIYANQDKDTKTAPGTSITGQATAAAPWKDPLGFDDKGKEDVFLWCGAQHEQYTPLCKEFDMGVVPSEIIANALDDYEWNYKWRNFRSWRRFWDESAYADAPAGMITDMRKFISLWEFDWSTGELADTFRRIGVVNPDPNGSDLQYYSQLTNKFNAELSTANQMVGAFHKAVIQQSSGERPYRTIYDKFYGDVTQQGIILDKLFAMQGWVAMWPTDNYDQNQAGDWFASYSLGEDSSYSYISEDAVTSMIGGQYDVYPYFVPLAVTQFAQDTHDPAFSGRIEVRDWIGGHVFTRLQDFLDFFRDQAAQTGYGGCTTVEGCSYDPRSVSDTHNEFLAPDKRTWIWAYIADRNQWVAVEKNRNTASYIIVRNYTDDVINQMDDGAFPGSAFDAELPMKYFLDSFNLFN